MATTEYTYVSTTEGCERDKLESLKSELKRRTKDVARLTAAIAFLEANPGAQALVNSL